MFKIIVDKHKQVVYSKAMQNHITYNEAKVITKHVCRDLDVSPLVVEARVKNGTLWGEYSFNPKGMSKIILYGKIKRKTVLHEIAHHVHQMRHDKKYQLSYAHNVTFHRICFEIRDLFFDLYGIDVAEISSNYANKGYYKALDEWTIRRGNKKGGIK